MPEEQLVCQISSPFDDEDHIRRALEQKLPSMKWEEGDSSWDKVRVWGKSEYATIRIYRYESPGPFRLTILAEPPALKELRDQVLEALKASIWNAAEAKPPEAPRKMTPDEIALARRRMKESIGED